MRNIIFLSALFYFSSCDQRGNSVSDNKQQDSVKPIQEEMKLYSDPELIKLFYSQNEGSQDRKYTEKDYNPTLPLISEILKARQFVQISDDAFDKKIQAIFGEVLAEGKCRVKHHDQYDILLVDKGGGEDNSDNILISKKYKLIASPLTLGALIKVVNKNEYKLPVSWNTNMISRSKYLLNDSKADLAILMSEDTGYLQTLVTTFGYTDDPKLNDIAMKTYANASDDAQMASVNNILFKKDCIGKLVIRKGLLKWIADHATAGDHRLLDQMDNYVSALYTEGEKQEGYAHDPYTYFTLNEKREIAAYVSDVYIPVFAKLMEAGVHDLPAVPAWADIKSVNDAGIVEYVKSKDYFHLAALKQEIESPNY